MMRRMRPTGANHLSRAKSSSPGNAIENEIQRGGRECAGWASMGWWQRYTYCWSAGCSVRVEVSGLDVRCR